ncbi:MAG: hypothetical protein L0387_32835 [Acidobacteria bacterium]|nr:hypothetical protein [Acidobacteriota bacterium]
MKHLINLSLTLTALSTGLAILSTCADEVTKWNEIATQAAFVSGLSGNPPFESRVYAMTHAAVHDALNEIDSRYHAYASDMAASPDASPEAAVATAAHAVLLDQFNRLTAFGFPAQQALLDAAYASSLALIPDDAAKTSGIATGEAAAAAILDLRANDGWDTPPLVDFNYPQGTAPGEYRFTPPFNFAFLPQWGNLPPFALHNAAQFRPGHPYPITSKRYTADFDEIKSLGGDGIITPEPAYSRTNPDCSFLGGKFSLTVESHRSLRLSRRRTQSVGERSALWTPQFRFGRRLYQFLRHQISLQLLAANHRRP